LSRSKTVGKKKGRWASRIVQLLFSLVYLLSIKEKKTKEKKHQPYPPELRILIL